jgi:hypothetical protein
MDLISQHKVFHGGTYNTNPVSMAAGLATFREVLTRANYAHVDKLGKKLADGYRKTIAKVELQAYIAQAGANGALMFYPKEIRNYRDWTTVDIDLWRHYWFAMVNRGVMAQPYWWDEQWTISVQHTEEDIAMHLQVFAEMQEHFSEQGWEAGRFDLDRVNVARLEAPPAVFNEHSDPAKELTGAETRADVLKLALKKEQYTIGYYTTLTEFALGEENLKVIRNIVQEEKRHVRILTQSLNQATG